MPNISSAAKRLRQSVRRQLINRMRKSRVKTAETNLDFILKAKEEDVATYLDKFFPAETKAAKEAGKATDKAFAVAAALSKCFSELDKAAKVGVIHSNKADRKKSRLVARVATLG